MKNIRVLVEGNDKKLRLFSLTSPVDVEMKEEKVREIPTVYIKDRHTSPICPRCGNYWVTEPFKRKLYVPRNAACGHCGFLFRTEVKEDIKYEN